MYGNKRVFESLDELYLELEKAWQTIYQDAIADHGAFHVALAGGNTPRRFYERLAQLPVFDEACWQKTHIYFGDERCVPQDHSDSNYHMAKETLLSAVPLLPELVHAMFSEELSAKENAAEYDALLHKTLPLDSKGKPVFDFVLLGMGDDGHTASLFPGTDILHESEKSVAAQFVEKFDAWRISLTFSTINAANHVAILVAGESKAKVLKDIFSDENNVAPQYPVQRVKPTGQLDWYLDAAAAQLLESQDYR